MNSITENINEDLVFSDSELPADINPCSPSYRGAQGTRSPAWRPPPARRYCTEQGLRACPLLFPVHLPFGRTPRRMCRPSCGWHRRSPGSHQPTRSTPAARCPWAHCRGRGTVGQAQNPTPTQTPPPKARPNHKNLHQELGAFWSFFLRTFWKAQGQENCKIQFTRLQLSFLNQGSKMYPSQVHCKAHNGNESTRKLSLHWFA